MSLGGIGPQRRIERAGVDVEVHASRRRDGGRRRTGDPRDKTDCNAADGRSAIVIMYRQRFPLTTPRFAPARKGRIENVARRV
jgi:NADPH-dependent glutamate synthase beta subunit-like oxidoreductase